VQLGLENKKQLRWAAVLGVLAIVAVSYEFIPMFTGTSSEPASSAQAAGPAALRITPRPGVKPGKKARVESLDPTLRLGLLASSEQTVYEGNGRNIFVSHAEDVVIQKPLGSGVTDAQKAEEAHGYVTPGPPPATPIPLKFYGFANKPGEPRKVFLSEGEELWVAGEGEIVNRRYKVIHINATSVEMQDVVNSGPPQSIPLTQG
jgi:hypothetical protein